MKTNFDATARSGQTESITQVLTRIQGMYVQERYFLMIEHWDWLVVLQCMQDHNLFRSNPQRPPLKEFVTFLEANHVPQYMAHCSVRTMSYANNSIGGARYPWTDVQWNRNVLERWKNLYETLDSMLHDATNVTE